MGIANWTTVPVSGHFVGTTGEPVVGYVWFTPAPSRLADGGEGITIIPTTIMVQLDANGAFEVELPCTDDPDISPSGWTYAVIEKFVGGQSYSISVPSAMADDGINLLTVAHVSPDQGLPGTITLSAFNTFAAHVNTLISQFNGGTVWSAYTPGAPLDGGFA